MVRIQFISFLVLALGISTSSQTYFVTPDTWTIWKPGQKVAIRLAEGYAEKADVQLIENGGFFPRDLGLIAKDVELDERQTLIFNVWDWLLPSKTYQLAFHPRTDNGNASTAFSQYFSIEPKNAQHFE
ncbi:hypothetical protein EC973_001411 [Apophysomyces ossiformis]|uniref:Uncharacterized protein n=1 Tax=Apophysomyces ossiformis TaxID=679940 RepID=A0A8H7ENL3_9FUNG|nr:hypothetical protein EC973_001411 [Apophysomyces ossiformis]